VSAGESGNKGGDGEGARLDLQAKTRGARGKRRPQKLARPSRGAPETRRPLQTRAEMNESEGGGGGGWEGGRSARSARARGEREGDGRSCPRVWRTRRAGARPARRRRIGDGDGGAEGRERSRDRARQGCRGRVTAIGGEGERDLPEEEVLLDGSEVLLQLVAPE